MYFLATGGGDTLSITEVLSHATEMFSWFITQMTSLVSFISQNPIILAMFLILLCGAVVGLFSRIWRSV